MFRPKPARQIAAPRKIPADLVLWAGITGKPGSTALKPVSLYAKKVIDNRPKLEENTIPV
jgi:hypothetical protein